MAGSGAGATSRVVGRGQADSTVQQTDFAPGRRSAGARRLATDRAGGARLLGRRRRLPAVPVDRWPAGGSVRNTGNNTGGGTDDSTDGPPTRNGGITNTRGIARGSSNAGISATPGDPGGISATLGDPGARNTARGGSRIPGIASGIAGSTT